MIYKKKINKSKCRLCKSTKEIDYKDYEFLKNFMNRKGKILGRTYTGNCSKCQKTVIRAIKRARTLALLPFST